MELSLLIGISTALIGALTAVYSIILYRQQKFSKVKGNMSSMAADLSELIELEKDLDNHWEQFYANIEKLQPADAGEIKPLWIKNKQRSEEILDRASKYYDKLTDMLEYIEPDVEEKPSSIWHWLSPKRRGWRSLRPEHESLSALADEQDEIVGKLR